MFLKTKRAGAPLRKPQPHLNRQVQTQAYPFSDQAEQQGEDKFQQHQLLLHPVTLFTR